MLIVVSDSASCCRIQLLLLLLLLLLSLLTATVLLFYRNIFLDNYEGSSKLYCLNVFTHFDICWKMKKPLMGFAGFENWNLELNHLVIRNDSFQSSNCKFEEGARGYFPSNFRIIWEIDYSKVISVKIHRKLIMVTERYGIPYVLCTRTSTHQKNFLFP